MSNFLSGVEGIFLGVVGTIIAAIMTYFGVAKKSGVDETFMALSAWKELVEPMQDQIRELKLEHSVLKGEHEQLKKDHECLKKDNGRLRVRIRSLEKEKGYEPSED